MQVHATTILTAGIDDGSCEFDKLHGMHRCVQACNYDAEATIADNDFLCLLRLRCFNFLHDRGGICAVRLG